MKLQFAILQHPLKYYLKTLKLGVYFGTTLKYKAFLIAVKMFQQQKLLLWLLMLMVMTLVPPSTCNIYGDNNYGEVYEYYDQSEEVPTPR